MWESEWFSIDLFKFDSAKKENLMKLNASNVAFCRGDKENGGSDGCSLTAVSQGIFVMTFLNSTLQSYSCVMNSSFVLLD